MNLASDYSFQYSQSDEQALWPMCDWNQTIRTSQHEPQLSSLDSPSHCCSGHLTCPHVAAQPGPRQLVDTPYQSQSLFESPFDLIEEEKLPSSFNGQQFSSGTASSFVVPASPTADNSPSSISDASQRDKPFQSHSLPSISPDSTPQKRPRIAHKIIERRYRDNLNNQLQTLHSKLPRTEERSCTSEIEELDEALHTKCPTKAVVIGTAIKYIDQMSQQKYDMARQIKALKVQVQGLQKLVRCDDCSLLKYMKEYQSGF